MRKIFSHLTFWVLTAIVLGALLGSFFPDIALQKIIDAPIKARLLGQEINIGVTLAEFLSGIFISAVKIFINPIIFLTIILGIISMGSLKKVGKVGGFALLYFEVVTTFALLIGIAVAWVIEPGRGVAVRAPAEDISKYVSSAEGFSWESFLESNSTLQVLVMAILLGVILSSFPNKKLDSGLREASKYIFKALHMVMLIAPIGAFGGMAYTIAKYGTSVLLPLMKLMASVYITMGLFIFVVLGLLLRMYNISVWKYLKFIKKEILIVLGTSSSEAALPSLMERLEQAGCSKPVVGLVVPAGYSFNLDGTTIYLSMAIMFLAQVFSVHMDIGQIAVMIGVLMLLSKGAAGVTGSGFIVLASTLSALKVIPIEGLAILIGIDRFMSEARAITNIIGNGAATIWLANFQKEFDRKKMEKAFGK